MNKISSVDSGEYKCRSSNEHGEKLSEALTLNVLYPPKSISVSISPSGEIVEGSSVTLTCSSDANPPVQNYTWFKEGGSSPVGSGHSYRALQSGSYYCVAQNEHGSQKSAAVTVTEKGVGNSALYAVIGVTAGCGCLSVIIAVFCVRRKRKGNSADDANQEQENLYSNVAVRPATSDSAADPDPSNQDDGDYDNVVPQRVRNPRNAESSAVAASAFGADEEVQYASVQHRRDKVVEKTKVDAQYASVRFSRTGAANRAATSTLEDPSVIYCSVK
ncbi:B-cell receptor CD22-like [Colossoma macropomum]|uniref:B-cell receptor CD22-like n=1 Tax=Colossoma macropomum TaxID=42526 RepID=UPI001863B196|nr:B-cell receptor CD22-like [Colossoma macropomum]